MGAVTLDPKPARCHPGVVKTVMKKIVDANYLQRPELHDYLTDSPDNYVVFTDFAFMEAHKGNALINISRSLEIVFDFPEQVMVLKDTRDVMALDFSSAHLPEHLVDDNRTVGFTEFCRQVQLAREGDATMSEEITRRGQWVSDYFEERRTRHDAIVDGIKGFIKSFEPSHLKALRTYQPLPPDMIEKAKKDVVLLSAFLFRDSPAATHRALSNGLRNHYIFRHTLSVYLLCLRWIADGGVDHLPPEKLGNDFVDMTYVSYATYFDGLLSGDKKMNELYGDTMWFLNHVF